MVAFEHSTTLVWVGWVLTFGYRNWIIILGVTPPAGISSSHHGALFIGIAKSNLLICFASCCSFKGSFALCRPFATCPYLLCRPSWLYWSTWWFSNLSTLVARFVSNDGGCINASLSTSLLLSTPNHYLREWLRNPFKSTLEFAVISGRPLRYKRWVIIIDPRLLEVHSVRRQDIYSRFWTCTCGTLGPIIIIGRFPSHLTTVFINDRWSNDTFPGSTSTHLFARDRFVPFGTAWRPRDRNTPHRC